MQAPERTIAEWFKLNEFKWSVKDQGQITPSESDVEAALDEAVRVMYDVEEGSHLSVGRLIIEKLHKGYAVYMYVGDYE